MSKKNGNWVVAIILGLVLVASLSAFLVFQLYRPDAQEQVEATDMGTDE